MGAAAGATAGGGAAAAEALREALSSWSSSSWTNTALAGIGGIPPIDNPGGGRAGEGAAASTVEGSLAAGDGAGTAAAGGMTGPSSGVPNDPNPKSKLCSSDSLVSQCPMLRTLDDVRGFAGAAPAVDRAAVLGGGSGARTTAGGAGGGVGSAATWGEDGGGACCFHACTAGGAGWGAAVVVGGATAGEATV